jgi:uncharacterized membrane protein
MKSPSSNCLVVTSTAVGLARQAGSSTGTALLTSGAHRSRYLGSLELAVGSNGVVDVLTEVEIQRPRTEVAAYASNPDNATSWYQNIKSVQWKTDRPLAVGSRIAFVAQFLGRQLAYTYEVKEMVPGERFVQSTSEGPFPMETTYTWADTPSGGTRMTLRNRGEPSGFSKVTAPMMAGAMRRANRKDLTRLKEILEATGNP